MDTVFITALQIDTVIGVHAHEQLAPRPLILDLELGVDIRDAAASDQLRDALDYAAVSDRLATLGRERRFQLIETFAETAARLLFAQYPIATLRLVVGKPGAVAAARTVGVRIDRVRADYVACGLR